MCKVLDRIRKDLHTRGVAPWVAPLILDRLRIVHGELLDLKESGSGGPPLPVPLAGGAGGGSLPEPPGKGEDKTANEKTGKEHKEKRERRKEKKKEKKDKDLERKAETEKKSVKKGEAEGEGDPVGAPVEPPSTMRKPPLRVQVSLGNAETRNLKHLGIHPEEKGT